MEIKLTKGKIAIVDEIDSDLSELKWRAPESHGVWHVIRHAPKHHGFVHLHRVIVERMVGRTLLKHEEVDHINGNGLDNRRANLRIVSDAQQSRNSSKPRFYLGRPTTSVYKGVTRDWKNKNKIWRAQITFDKRVYNLGRFTSESDAAKAYDRKAHEVFGEYAKLNFPSDYA